MAAPSGSAPKKPMMPPRPGAKKPAPASSESFDDSEPLLGDDDEDEVLAQPQPVKPSARMAPPAPAAPAKPAAAKPAAASSGVSARSAAPVKAAPAKAPVKPPPPVQNDDDEDSDLEDDIGDDGDVDVTAATREMPAAKVKPSGREAAGSGRRTLNAGKRAAPVEDDEEEQEEDEKPARASKNSSRQSARSSSKSSGKNGPRKGISKVKLIGAGILVLAILVVAVGYKPFMRSQYAKAVVEGATVEDRKAGADSLMDNFPDHAFEVFAEHVASSNAPLREVAIYGLGALGKTGNSKRATESQRRGEVIEKLGDALKSADGAAKMQTVKALGGIVEKVSNGMGKGTDGQPAPEEKQAAQLADSLLPLSEPVGDADINLRRESIGLLAKLRAPRVCKQMIKLATSDPQLKSEARAAIAPTALPEAAGDLLRAMTSEDKALADSAKRAFVAIRDTAPSKDIVALVGDSSVDVRREIVEALGKRKGDAIAAQGITKALRDSEASIRLLAVNAVPITGVSGPISQLGDLSKDASEDVRVASGDVLGKLRDGDSYTVLLDAFKNNLSGKALDAYVKALGARARGKDMKNIGMAIGLLDSSPGSEASIREALVLLCNNGVGPSRDKIRKAWTTAQWKAWYAKINERETLRAEAAAKIKEAQAARNADRTTFVKWKNVVEKAMDQYEKAQNMCQPDDAEDAKSFDVEIKQASVTKDYFIKGASFDLR